MFLFEFERGRASIFTTISDHLSLPETFVSYTIIKIATHYVPLFPIFLHVQTTEDAELYSSRFEGKLSKRESILSEVSFKLPFIYLLAYTMG